MLRTILYDHERKAILARDHGKCVKCGNPATEVDHILPRHMDGGRERFNLQSLCKPCHQEKTSWQDNLHGSLRWENHEERAALRESARHRAQEYAAHSAGECDEDECRYCNDLYDEIAEDKDADDATRHWMYVEEQTRYLCDNDERDPYLDRIAVAIAYAAFAEDRDEWVGRLEKWTRADHARALGLPGATVVGRYPLAKWIGEAIHYLRTGATTPISPDNGLVGRDGTFKDASVGRKIREAHAYYHPVRQQSLL